MSEETCRYLKGEMCLAKKPDGRYVDGQGDGQTPIKCACIPAAHQDPETIPNIRECRRITSALLAESQPTSQA